MSVLTRLENNRTVFSNPQLHPGFLLSESRFIFSFGAAEGKVNLRQLRE
jgi:hypothetical protein